MQYFMYNNFWIPLVCFAFCTLLHMTKYGLLRGFIDKTRDTKSCLKLVADKDLISIERMCGKCGWEYALGEECVKTNGYEWWCTRWHWASNLLHTVIFIFYFFNYFLNSKLTLLQMLTIMHVWNHGCKQAETTWDLQVSKNIMTNCFIFAWIFVAKCWKVVVLERSWRLTNWNLARKASLRIIIQKTMDLWRSGTRWYQPHVFDGYI